MILSDTEITTLVTEVGMIDPFLPALVRTRREGKRVLSPREFFVFQPLRGGDTETHAVVDPKNFSPAHLIPTPLHNSPEGDSYFVLPAHSYGTRAGKYQHQPESVITARI